MSSYIPYGRQHITEDDIKSVVEVLRSPYITQGPQLEQFEESVSNAVNAKYSVAVSSATAALHLACLALDLSPGDILWTTPTTFVASANCALYCRASIDFVDIERSTGLISVDLLEDKLIKAKSANALPKVLVVVHLTGTSCDMQPIKQLSEKYNFSIIEDASHAIGGRYDSQPVGSCLYSDLTVFSFHPVKIITTGEGGVISTNNLSLAQKLKTLRSHGIIKDHSSFEYQAPGPWAYEQQELGYNYRLTDIQAALGISQLKRLKSVVQERTIIKNIYREQIQCLPARILAEPSKSQSSVHLVVLDLIRSDPDFHRNIFLWLRNNGIGVQLHYTPVHLQPYYRKIGFNVGDFPNSEDYAINAISLPVYPGLSPTCQSKVINCLFEAFAKYS